jgi:hypothetical protein
MRGILFERGKWLGVSRLTITDTRLQVSILKLDFLTLGFRWVELKFVQRGLDQLVYQLCREWALEAKTFNVVPLADDLSKSIMKLIYQAQAGKL